MAYEQHAAYHQPPQQYMSRPPPQQQQQYNGYAQDEYGYDGYNDGYAEPQYADNGQRPPPRQQQYQDDHGYGHPGMNGQGRGPPPQNGGWVEGRGPPQGRPNPRWHQGQQGGGPRGPVQGGPNGRPVPRGPSQGFGEQQNMGRQPPSQKQATRPLVAYEEPATITQDNAFPSFPTKKSQSRPNTSDINNGMANMNIQNGRRSGDRPSGDRPRGPSEPGPRSPTGPGPYQEQQFDGGYDQRQRSRSDQEQHGRPQNYGPPQNMREDPRQFRGPPPGQMPQGQQQMPPRAMSARPQQEYHQGPPQRSQTARPQAHAHRNASNPGPLPQQMQPLAQNNQRAMTMPRNVTDLQRDGSQREVEPGPTAGYYGPESPSFIPPRPPTAPGTRAQQLPNDFHRSNSDPSNHYHQGPPPMPNMPQQYAQKDKHDTLVGVLDSYYSGPEQRSSIPSTSREAAIEVEMPDFDAQPVTSPPTHRRGDSFERHLGVGPTRAATFNEQAPAPPNQNQGFYQQAHKAQSQPNLRSDEAIVFEMPGDIPAVPPMPRTNSSSQQRMPPPRQGLPAAPRPGGRPNGAPAPLPPGQMPYRVPPPGQMGQMGAQGMSPQGYQQDSRGQMRPPMNRDISQWSDPGPQGYQQQQRGPPILTEPQGPPSQPRGSFDQGMGEPLQQRRSNPDALPQHPTPVRLGHLDQAPSLPHAGNAPNKPPPVRLYNAGDPMPGQSQQRRVSEPINTPVTHAEIARLRGILKTKPSDHRTGLTLVKRLIEASTSLINEGGRADPKARNKNREKFIFDATKLLKKLVSAGYPEAMFFLADCYGSGSLGLPVDTKEAFSLYQSAAKGGHAASAYRTAVCCELGPDDGGGTKKDPLKAVQWYKRAAALGDTPAMYKMGMILLKGLLGQPRNIGEALNWLKRAADRADVDNPHALHELGLLYENPPPDMRNKIIKDEAYALSLFQKGSELGYKFSQFRIAQALEFGLFGVPINPRASITYYTKAAAQGEHQSELALSGWYLTGATGILEQSDTEAFLWARKAAVKGELPKAMFAMGYFAEVGIGCQADINEARRWYGRAASYKFLKAQERLEELKKGGSKAAQQRGRERLSRSNPKHNDQDCIVM